MNIKRLLVFTLVIAVAALSWWRFQETASSADIQLGNANAPQAIKPAASDHKELAAVAVDEPLQTNDLDRLHQARSDAALKVELAELRLEALDSQISSLEAQISDIERRGDDPVEHAAEVEPYLRPVLAEYFDAQAQYDEAVAEKAKADAALASPLN